jgi:hypothetical protein
MPLAGTLALSNFLNPAAGSSSRKVRPFTSVQLIFTFARSCERCLFQRSNSSKQRSHAEITRSESPGTSPDRLPSKRRRINPTTLFASNPSPPPSRQPSPDRIEPRLRFEGDGYDYRRPAMASRSQRQTATPAPNDVVDLTFDDSDDISTASEDSSLPQTSNPPSTRESRAARVAAWQQAAFRHHDRQESRRQLERERHVQIAQGEAELEVTGVAQPQHRLRGMPLTTLLHGRPTEQQRRESQPRAPPFDQRLQERSVIVLSESDEEESDFGLDEFDIPSDAETNDSNSIASIDSPEVQFIEERPIPQPRRPQAEIAADVAHMERGPGPFPLNMPHILRRGAELVFETMQQTVRNYNEGFLDRLDGVPRRNQPNEGGAMAVHMDYGRAAFAMGFDPFDRSSETPQVIQEPYKAPPAAKEGFTRTYGEDDVILCPMCGDELAIGKGDVKQQVWVVKQCGHVSDPVSS